MPAHRYSENSIEALQMDHLRSAPSQQHLVNSSRSPSLNHQDDQEADDQSLEQQQQNRPHKLDYYSIPVFLLEVIVLLGLTYSAYYIHFQYKHEPNVSGFYCDDTTLRQHFVQTNFVRSFIKEDNEIVVIGLLLAVPITLIIFCELVNSMFGSLKFRQISALCACCKLHSITRRTIRFSGAYALGFLIVMISCDILANTSGRLRPYFAQECPDVYFKLCNPSSGLSNASQPQRLISTTSRPMDDQFVPSPSAQVITAANLSTDLSDTSRLVHPPSRPISSDETNMSLSVIQPKLNTSDQQASNDSVLQRFKRDTGIENRRLFFERQWVDLRNSKMSENCNFHGGDDDAIRFFDTLAMSWPSFPAAIVTYSCLFIACYLCFVGTARPFRLISSVLVVCLLLMATIFDVRLVNEHFNHWEDVAGGAILALVVVLFVLYVYLNKFRDTHYYENQKVVGNRRSIGRNSTSFNKRYNNDIALNQYNLDKIEGDARNGETLQNGDTVGSISNNDLAMRYFQIPRANYRGAPRPMSSMRS